MTHTITSFISFASGYTNWHRSLVTAVIYILQCDTFCSLVRWQNFLFALTLTACWLSLCPSATVHWECCYVLPPVDAAYTCITEARQSSVVFPPFHVYGSLLTWLLHITQAVHNMLSRVHHSPDFVMLQRHARLCVYCFLLLRRQPNVTKPWHSEAPLA